MPATAAFRYLKKDCPICNGARRDCRQSNTTNAIHCRADVSAPAGYEGTGFDAQGFTVYVLGTSASNPAYWAERERQQQQRELERQHPKRPRLSLSERDRQFRIVASHSNLSIRHRQQLELRCRQAELSPTVIDHLLSQRLLFTWQPGQDFPGVTAGLPGTDRWGKLRRGYQGWAIGVPNAAGQILGYQVKPDDGEGYLWLSSASKDGDSPHLPNGELPMGVYWPLQLKATNRIGLSEGYAKAAIAAERFGIPFIGMAGGHFPPEQFAEAVKAIRRRCPSAQLVLFPDAGQLEGKHANVHSAWRKLGELCDRMGESLAVAWWGQTEKAHGDVDEAPMAAINRGTLIDLDALLAKVTATAQEGWQQQWEEQARAAWERCRRYSPDTTAETRYAQASLADVMAVDIHALKSGMGTGKTQAIATLLGQTNLGVIAIGSRNSLLLQSCERWGGFYHLHEDSAFGMTADPSGRIACCVDSLKHFADNDFTGKIVIIDEVLSVVKHALLSATLKDKRDKALAKFEQAIKRAAVVIAWDGNNADIAINYLANLRGEHSRVLKALNTYRGDRLQVEMVRVLGKDGTVWLSNNKPVLTKIGDALRAGQVVTEGRKAVVVVADNQMLLEALDDVYSQQGYRCQRCDSKTTTSEEMKAILKDPDAYLRENRIDLLLLSPSAESGLDISIKNYFAKGFGLFFGNIDTATQMQILRRVRDCQDWTVWCVEYTTAEDLEGSRSPFARKIHSQLTTYLQADAVAALQGKDSQLTESFIARLKEQATSVHYQTTLQFMAARNYERQHTRQCLQESLEQAGHAVTLVDVLGEGTESADTLALKQAKEDLIQAEAHAIFTSPDISTTEAARIKSSFCSTIEDRRAAEKAVLKARLPGIEATAEWTPEFIATVLFRERDLIRKMERYWLMNNPAAAQIRSQETYMQALEYGTFLPDLRSDYFLLKALNHLGLTRLAESIHDRTSPQVQAIYAKVKGSKRLQAALGRGPGKLEPMAWIGRLCRMVGIVSSSCLKPKSQRGGDRGERSYAYTLPEHDPLLATLLRCIARRFEKYTHPDASETPALQGVEGGSPPTISNRYSSEGDPPQIKGTKRVYGIDQALVAEARQMMSEVAPDQWHLIRPCFPDEVWTEAIAA